MTIPIPGNFFISLLDKEGFVERFPFNKLLRNDINGLIVIMISGGEGCLKINDKEYTAQAGTLISLLPFHLIENHYVSDNFSCNYLLYRFDFMADFPFVLKSEISERIGNKPYLILNPDEYEHLNEFYSFISKQYNRYDHPSREEIIKAHSLR